MSQKEHEKGGFFKKRIYDEFKRGNVIIKFLLLAFKMATRTVNKEMNNFAQKQNELIVNRPRSMANEP